MAGRYEIHSKVGKDGMGGPRLGEKIHRERTELKELLKLLQWVAEALEGPRGIVHRDLKLANIMITREG